MQTTCLPKTCCENIEKIIRAFIWGSGDTNRKPSLMRWNKLCQLLKHGVGGLKSMQGQNCAFLCKLAFQMLTVNRTSYGCKFSVLSLGGLHSSAKTYTFKTRTASHIWRSLARVWVDMELHVSWKLGDRKIIRFWSDSWVVWDHSNFSPLLTFLRPRQKLPCSCRNR
ncbi:hypothetical protein K1719_043534 [Acacia pycnantha]|nr:hypothetical protein K1719_043534 [Acacia pycnantha]